MYLRGLETTLILWAVLISADALAANKAQHLRGEIPEMWRASTLDALTTRADGNSLAAAAVLSLRDSAVTASKLADHAVQLMPDNAGIGWLRLQICARSPTCDLRETATTTRWTDSDNAAAWLPLLPIAQKDRDAQEIDRILAAMAQGSRFDLYWNPLVALLFDALKRVRHATHHDYLSADWQRLSFVSSLASAELLPAFSPLIDVCRDLSSSIERRHACLNVAKTMQKSDTLLAQMAGLSIERRLASSDGKDVRAILERRRTLSWRMTASAEVDSPLLPWSKNARARWRLARMRTLPREEDVCIAILKDHHLVLYPPKTE